MLIESVVSDLHTVSQDVLSVCDTKHPSVVAGGSVEMLKCYYENQ